MALYINPLWLEAYCAKAGEAVVAEHAEPPALLPRQRQCVAVHAALLVGIEALVAVEGSRHQAEQGKLLICGHRRPRVHEGHAKHSWVLRVSKNRMEAPVTTMAEMKGGASTAASLVG